MLLQPWEDMYRKSPKPRLHDAMTGFNINLDRCIPVTADLLASADFYDPDLAELRLRLTTLMSSCSAEEWHVADPVQYTRFLRSFRKAGTLSLGGQAGIAARHLAGLGVRRVVCVVPHHGPESAAILERQGVLVPSLSPFSGLRDQEHLVFEYSPGLVPLAEGAIPRNNRFIVSPVHEPSSVLVPEESMENLLPVIAPCTRAFLSGFQYLRTDADFSRAADCLARMKAGNPSLRIHIEWVSIRQEAALQGCLRHILPRADSLGLNEYELQVLSGQTGIQELPGNGGGMLPLSPAELMQAAGELRRRQNLKRLHVHTFGYYVLVLHEDAGDPLVSRTALLYAARGAAAVAGGTGSAFTSAGRCALAAAEEAFGKPSSPGIFAGDDSWVIVVPTLIAPNAEKTVGLGDVLSSAALVADEF